MNQPIGLCFHDLAMIRTCTYIYVKEICLHQCDIIESISKLFFIGKRFYSGDVGLRHIDFVLKILADNVDCVTFVKTNYLSYETWF